MNYLIQLMFDSFNEISLTEKILVVFFWGIMVGFVVSMFVIIYLMFKDLFTLVKIEQEETRRIG